MIKKITGFIVLFAAFFSAVYAADCNIYGLTDKQYIRGFGASSAWSDWGGNSAGNTWLVSHADEFFTTTSGIGLTIIRARINPVQSEWGNTAPPLQAARDRGATEIFATAWTPPAQWKSNNAVDNQNGGYLLPQYYQNYANYLRDYVIYMRDQKQVNITAISPANEPDYRVSYDGCDWTGEQLRDFVKGYLGPTFQAAGLTTKIIIGESFANNCAYVNPTVLDSVARGFLFAGATHFYGGGPYDCPNLGTYGKEFWQTEKSNFTAYDGSITHGLITAEWIHSGFVTGNYNVFLYWWLASDQTNEGLTSVTLGTPKRYYTFGNFSKFVRPGYYRIDATAAPTTNVLVTAYRSGDRSKYVIVAINKNTSATSQKFVLNNIPDGTYNVYVTSSTQNLAQVSNINVTGGSFTYSLPAQSVVSFVSLGGPTPTPTFTVTGTPPTNTPTSTATPLPASILFDDFEDLNYKNNFNGDNYKYNGNNSNNFAMQFLQPGAASTGNYIRITGTVADYGGFGMNFAASGAADLSAYQGIEFYIKGSGTYWLQFTQDSITDYDYHGIVVTATSTWTKVTVLFSQLAQKNGTNPVAFTKNALNAVQWASNGNGAFDLQLDEIRLLYNSSITPTYTNTIPPPTNTATRTFTNTYTATYTNTPTFTNTPVPPTSTNTSTYTATATNTATRTFTNTATNTPVPPTSTNTNTSVPATSTHTNTQVPPTLTNTSTNTSTATYTYTITYTPSETVTTGGPTLTFTQTYTNTYTATHTATNTYTDIPTSTPTNAPPTSTHTSTATAIIPTSTNTTVSTSTYTPVNTATFTHTSTNTYTNTPVPPTATNTASNTSTRTYTQTPTNTMTRTPTYTFTQTYTYTHTETIVPSFTNTHTFTATITPTPTPSDAKEQEIKDILLYPHPYDAAKDNLKIMYTITKRAQSVKLLIYSSAFRLIREVEIGRALYAGTHIGEVKASQIRQLANGTYYFVVKDNEGKRSKADKLIVLK